MSNMQVALDDNDQAAVGQLKSASGIQTDEELVKTALQVYHFLLDQTQNKGKQVYIGVGGKPEQVVTIPKK